jgi:hypothetical protein
MCSGNPNLPSPIPLLLPLPPQLLCATRGGGQGRYINEIPKAWVAHAGGWAGKGRAGGWRCGGAATKSGDDWGSGAEFRHGPNPYRPPSLGAPMHQQPSVETPPQPEYRAMIGF